MSLDGVRSRYARYAAVYVCAIARQQELLAAPDLSAELVQSAAAELEALQARLEECQQVLAMEDEQLERHLRQVVELMLARFQRSFNIRF